jgi:hypothetical protein
MQSSILLLVSLLALVLPTHVPFAVALVSPPKEDKLLVAQQLGYFPPNYREVSAWTLDGSLPVAIKTYPLNGGAPRRQAKADIQQVSLGTPFPTLYWLTSPDISRAISNLERQGFVSVIEEKLNSDSVFDSDSAARFFACHEHYAKERWESLSKEDCTLFELYDSSSVQSMREMLQSSGVAGTNHTAQIQSDGTFRASVKCLHAHYAHYRSKQVDEHESGFNPVGYWVHELLSSEFPDTKL